MQEFEDELLVFPRGAHDDQCDNVSMACDAIGGAKKTPEDHLEFMRQRLAKMKAPPLPQPQTARHF